MSSPDHPDDGSPERGAPQDENAAEPAERSTRGRLVIRSSSHPPRVTQPEIDVREVSGARTLPAGAVEREAQSGDGDEGRSKRATPAERPRKRRQVQAGQAFTRVRRDTLPARPVSLRRRGESDPAGVDQKNAGPSADARGMATSGAQPVERRDDPAATSAPAAPEATSSSKPPPAGSAEPRAWSVRSLRTRAVTAEIAVIALAVALIWALLRR